MSARKPRPIPLAERVAASRARAIEAGARPTPRGLLPPDAAKALDVLMETGYAGSQTACIARALVAVSRRRAR